MKIHSDVITREDLFRVLPTGVHAYVTNHGSRKRARAFDVTLYVFEKDELHRRFGNSGGYGSADDVAATWDEWGIWMERLYAIDHDALIGHYKSHADFIEQTTRYRDGVRRFKKSHTLVYRTHTAPWLKCPKCGMDRHNADQWRSTVER